MALIMTIALGSKGTESENANSCFPYNKFFDSSPPGQSSHHFADDIFKCMFLNENFENFISIFIKICS